MRALVLLLVASEAWCQPAFVAEVSTDKPAYSYGEPITVTYVLRNEGAKTATIWASSGCFPGLEVAPSVWMTDFPCTLGNEPVTVSPGGSFTATWRVDPFRVGVPVVDGRQTWTVWLAGECGINGENGQDFYAPTSEFDCDVSANVVLEAPRFEGGGIVVDYDLVNADSAVAIRRSLGATVLDSTSSTRYASELWSVEGAPVDSLVVDLEANDIILYARVNRQASPTREFAVSVEDDLEAASLSAPSPNPAVAWTALTVYLPAPDIVTVDVFDALGRHVASLHDGVLEAGEHRVVLEVGTFAPGSYVIRSSGSSGVQSRRFAVVR